MMVYFTWKEITMGGGGGVCLALLWKGKNMVQLRSFSKNHIDVEITWEDAPKWKATCFYGFPERHPRKDLRQLIKRLKSSLDMPWWILGEFNDLRAHSEKRGGQRQPNNLIHGFRNAINFRGLKGVAMQGYPFTWERG